MSPADQIERIALLTVAAIGLGQLVTLAVVGWLVVRVTRRGGGRP